MNKEKSENSRENDKYRRQAKISKTVLYKSLKEKRIMGQWRRNNIFLKLHKRNFPEKKIKKTRLHIERAHLVPGEINPEDQY